MTKYISKNFTFPITMLVAIVILFSSCKSQKKVTEVSDTKEVKSQVESQVIAQPEETPVVINKVASKTIGVEERLSNYFGSIASASSTTSANASIQEALTMFSSPEAPVLIMIYKEGSTPDYDEPTTISKYLNYLKDTKNNKAQIEDVTYDTNGKIKELVLKK